MAGEGKKPKFPVDTSKPPVLGDSWLPPLSDDELDELSRITPEDVARAQGRWQRDASPPYRDLLDASEEET